MAPKSMSKKIVFGDRFQKKPFYTREINQNAGGQRICFHAVDTGPLGETTANKIEKSCVPAFLRNLYPQPPGREMSDLGPTAG